MKVLPDLNQSEHRPTHLRSQHVKGNELADRHLVGDHDPGTQKQSERADAFVQEVGSLSGPVSYLGGGE